MKSARLEELRAATDAERGEDDVAGLSLHALPSRALAARPRYQFLRGLQRPPCQPARHPQRQPDFYQVLVYFLWSEV